MGVRALGSGCMASGLVRNVKRFRGGLVFKKQRLMYHSTLGLRVIKKKGLVTSASARVRSASSTAACSFPRASLTASRSAMA